MITDTSHRIEKFFPMEVPHKKSDRRVCIGSLITDTTSAVTD
jgi:hypothetical protein